MDTIPHAPVLVKPAPEHPAPTTATADSPAPAASEPAPRSLLADIRSPDPRRREAAEVRLWTLVRERAERIVRSAGRRDIQPTSVGNQVYANAFRKAADKALDDEHLVAFVTTCTLRVVLDRIRASRRMAGEAALDGPRQPQAPDPQPADALSQAEDRERSAAGLARLAETIATAPLDAACIDLAQQLLVRGHSRALIARSRGETPGAIRQRLHRCRDELLEHLLAPLVDGLPTGVTAAAASTLALPDEDARAKVGGAVTPALLRQSWETLERRYGPIGAARLFLLLPEDRAEGSRSARSSGSRKGRRSGG